jgi:hypothetical protein
VSCVSNGTLQYKRCRATNGHYSEADEKYDLLNFFAKSKSDVENELKTGRERVCDLKWYARVQMVRNIDNGQQEKDNGTFS